MNGLYINITNNIICYYVEEIKNEKNRINIKHNACIGHCICFRMYFDSE